MKKKKFFTYRIKDVHTGLYFNKEYYQHNVNSNPELLEKCQYKVDKIVNYRTAYNSGGQDRYLYFNEEGNKFPTKLGAERQVSRFNRNSIHDRKTKAARILNCKFPFIVVKTEIKYKDIEE